MSEKLILVHVLKTIVRGKKNTFKPTLGRAMMGRSELYWYCNW